MDGMEIRRRLAAEAGFDIVPLDEVQAMCGQPCKAGWYLVGWSRGFWVGSHLDSKEPGTAFVAEGDGTAGKPQWLRKREDTLVQRAEFLGYRLVSSEEVARAAGRTPREMGWKYVKLGENVDQALEKTSPNWIIETPHSGPTTYGTYRGLFAPINSGHTEKAESTQKEEADMGMKRQVNVNGEAWTMLSDASAEKVLALNAEEQDFLRVGLGAFPEEGYLLRHEDEGPIPHRSMDKYGKDWALYFRTGLYYQVEDYFTRLRSARDEELNATTANNYEAETKEQEEVVTKNVETTAMTFGERAGAFGKEAAVQGLGMAAGMTAVDAFQYSIESTLGVGTNTWFKMFQKGKLARMYLHVKKMRGGNRAIRLVLSAIIGVASLVATKQAKGEEVAPILALLPNILARMGIRVAIGAAASEVAFAVQEAVYAAGPLLKQWFDTPIGEEVKEAIVESFAEEDRVGVREALRQVQQGRTM